MAEQSAEDRAISAFMADEPSQPVDQPANPPAEATEVEAAPAPVQEEPTEELKAEQQPEEVQTIEIDPDEPLFEQEVEEDGKKVAQKLSLKELQQGYLREKDYRKKTMDLARQREELPKLVAKQGQELSESYTQRLSELQGLVLKTVAADLQKHDLDQLANEDYAEYIRISHQARKVNELLQTVQQELVAEAQKRKQQEEKTSVERWQKSLEILSTEIPNFGPDVVKRIIDVAVERGYSQEEAGSLTDHKIIKLLYDVSEKKLTESKRPEIEKKVAVVTKTMKPGQTNPPRSQLDEARAKLRKTGKPDHALPFFEAMLR